MIDAARRGRSNFAVGDTVRVAASGPVEPFRIIGIARYGDVDSLGGATFAVFDVPTAQRLLDARTASTRSRSRPRAGVSPARLLVAIEPLLPSTTQVRTGAEQAQRRPARSIAFFIDIIRYFLLASAAWRCSWARS